MTFIDISEYNGVVDFNGVKSDGHEAVFCRHSDGSYDDKKCDSYIRSASDIGLLVGIYHFARTESKNFKSDIERSYNYCVSHDLDLKYALDLEVPESNAIIGSETTTLPNGKKLVKYTLKPGAKKKLETVINNIEYADSVMKDDYIVYTGRSFVDMFSLVGEFYNRFLKILNSKPIWWAHYTLAKKPTISQGMKRWDAWQYRGNAFPQFNIPAGKCSGISTAVDLNTFNDDTSISKFLHR